jgi:hypothetical protein
MVGIASLLAAEVDPGMYPSPRHPARFEPSFREFDIILG